MQMIKQCFFLLILASAALFMPHAKAACTTPDMPKMINVASVSVPTTLAIGETIPGTEQTVHVAGQCDQSIDSGLEIVSCYYGTGAEIPGLRGVYDSGVPGVGIALMNEQGQRISGAGGVQCDSRGTPIGYVSSDGQQSFNFNVTLELVKTGSDVTSGTLVQAQTEFGIGVFGHEGIGSPNHIAYAGNVDLETVTCSVLPKNLTVNLGDFPISDFMGVGTLSMPAQNFNVTVNCNSTVQPEVKITSANGYESGFAGVMKLTQQSGMATGVGVRMLFDGNIATFDNYVNTQSEAKANETLDIPFQVRYEQISGDVTPGPANTIATITLAYK
ncbi:fimbrial protein [Citrobacter koseri]|uniref:fimbrial protein n=1 Tax=Citrobacter TaxID=544 RepID=UPI001908115D|nr:MULTISPECIES: fimbrial protein [Citrobacter]MBJ9139610.1 fimbrial protein [Citrobacter koseri]MDM2946359.1 fimbrial protein [Citrobacter sp. CK207]HBC5384954.1 fimbrial protein [Citrobacter koseri]HCR9764981.1 fimbrial protein [Citrobacter koseri]HCT7630666.1 fimbrial protein [Citrobacter koseri]